MVQPLNPEYTPLTFQLYHLLTDERKYRAETYISDSATTINSQIRRPHPALGQRGIGCGLIPLILRGDTCPAGDRIKNKTISID